MTFRKPPAPPGSLAAYLRRAGLLAEASAAEGDLSDPMKRLALEEVLRQQKEQLPISPDPEEMKQLLTFLFGNTADLVFRNHKFGPAALSAISVAINGMVDRTLAERGIASLQNDLEATAAPADPDALVDWMAVQRSSIPNTLIEDRFAPTVRALLDGHALIFFAGSTRVLHLVAPGWETRSIMEPETERVVRGPKEGFTEALATSTSLIRRRLRDERLRIEQMVIGTVTGTRVALVHISGICRPELVAEARSRLQRIKIDGVIDSGYLEEFIEDTPWTLFPLIKSTERPDVVTAALLEGRFAILMDGSPFALIAPTSFVDLMQAPEDYYERFPVVFMLRFLRWMFASVALLGPAFYVAFTTYHHEMLPNAFLLSIMASREGVPFPAVVEALMMEIAFEALREAGIRMPKAVGQAISIVGALVIGQAAVQAGIVSAPMVIVVSLTGLASFVVPKFSAAIPMRILRFVMLGLAAVFGAYGITLGVLVVLLHLLSLRTFGAPYYGPLGPLVPDDLDDTILRSPHWANRTRPSDTSPLDKVRTASGLEPGPDQPDPDSPHPSQKEEQP